MILVNGLKGGLCEVSAADIIKNIISLVLIFQKEQNLFR